jgi:transcriptional regulator of acetoin/glycerol metabolism
MNLRQGKHIQGIDQAVLTSLMSHSFPGNIRELENIIEHAFVLCHGSTIETTCLPPYLHPSQTAVHPPVNNLAEYERNLVLEALKRNGWNRTRTAEELGIHKATLWRKMKRLEIDPASKQ